MEKLINGYCRLLDFVIAAALAAMVVLVFGNVVLRYAFNTGITMSEEVSRWLFVWLVFLGAVVALKDGLHLGSDMMVSRLPLAGKKACALAGHAIMLYITWLLFSGSLAQVRINADVAAPVTGISVGIFYGAGIAFSIPVALLLLRGIWRLLRGEMAEKELVMVRESEEEAEIDVLQAQLASRNVGVKEMDATAGVPGARPKDSL